MRPTLNPSLWPLAQLAFVLAGFALIYLVDRLVPGPRRDAGRRETGPAPAARLRPVRSAPRRPFGHRDDAADSPSPHFRPSRPRA